MKRSMLGLAVLSCIPREATADYVFSNDFNDNKADGWTFLEFDPRGPGDWSVENGTLVQHTRTDGNVGLVDQLVVSDQVIEAQIRTAGYAGLVLWYAQVDDHWANYVTVNYNVGYAKIILAEVADRQVNNYFYDAPWMGSDRWFDLRLEADSAAGSVAAFLDGVNVFTHVVSTSYRTGMSGVYSGNEHGYFDDFRITAPPNAAPTAIADEYSTAENKILTGMALFLVR